MVINIVVRGMGGFSKACSESRCSGLSTGLRASSAEVDHFSERTAPGGPLGDSPL